MTIARRFPKDLCIPEPYHTQADAITQQAIKDVRTYFSEHFGDLEPFHFATSRQAALRHLRHFIAHNLPYFW